MDVGQHTTLGDGDVSQKLVQLLIVADGELQVTRNDTGLLVVAGSVASQLENLGSEVLENGSQVDGGTGTDTLGVVALAKQTVDTTDRESQTGLGGTTGNALLGDLLLADFRKTREDALKVFIGASSVLTIARSWSRWPCRRTCLQSF